MKLFFLASFYIFYFSQGTERGEIIIGPTDFLPQKDDVYICGSLPMNEHGRYYIQSFTNQVTREKVHHFAIMACKEPGSTDKYWNSALSSGARQPGLEVAPPCKHSVTLIDFTLFVWEEDTNDVTFPGDVAYEVGWDTEWKYLVYEIHYPKVNHFKDGVADSSKMVITYQTNKTKHSAGYLGSAPYIKNVTKMPKQQDSNIDIIYVIPKAEIHPMLYQVHTHKLGIKVSGYWVKYNSSDPDNTKWIEIGARDPTLPQLFLPTETNGPMEQGDLFVVRCHYFNFRDFDVYVGNKVTDEMCNFYVLYWSDWGKQLPYSFIQRNYTIPFEDFGLKNIPDDIL